MAVDFPTTQEQLLQTIVFIVSNHGWGFFQGFASNNLIPVTVKLNLLSKLTASCNRVAESKDVTSIKLYFMAITVRLTLLQELAL